MLIMQFDKKKAFSSKLPDAHTTHLILNLLLLLLFFYLTNKNKNKNNSIKDLQHAASILQLF